MRTLDTSPIARAPVAGHRLQCCALVLCSILCIVRCVQATHVHPSTGPFPFMWQKKSFDFSRQSPCGTIRDVGICSARLRQPSFWNPLCYLNTVICSFSKIGQPFLSPQPIYPAEYSHRQASIYRYIYTHTHIYISTQFLQKKRLTRRKDRFQLSRLGVGDFVGDKLATEWMSHRMLLNWC